MKTNLSQLQSQLILGLVSLSQEELTNELEKFEGKNVMINIVNGFSGLIFLDDFSFAECSNNDGNNINTNEYLSFDTYDEEKYIINKDEIGNAYKDNCLGQIFIKLMNEQVLQIYTDTDIDEFDSNGDL